MTSLDRVLSLLQLSPDSQRVITAAVRDWQHEVTTARSVGGAMLAHARGVAALARVSGMVIAESSLPALHPAWLAALLLPTLLIVYLTTARIEPTLVFFARGVVPLAILFGPDHRRSPVFGFAPLQIAAGVVTCAVSPSLSWLLMAEATLTSILAGAVADRLRTDVSRERVTLLAGLTLVGVWYVSVNLALGLRLDGVSELTIERVLWLWLAVSLAAMWWWLERAPIAPRYWAQLRLWIRDR